MNTRNFIIIKYLKEVGEYVTAESLSALCHVSTKTILKDIKSINDDMKVSNNYIEVRPSHGIKLIIHDMDAFSNLSDSYRPFQDYFMLSVNEREDWIQKYLLEANDWIKADFLCEMLFISPSVLSQNLKEVRKSLKKYDLKLLQKPHYGMKVEGREFNKRLCLSQIYISYIDQREDFPGAQFKEEDLAFIQSINHIVENTLIDYEVAMSQVSVQNFVIDIYVSLKRIKQGILLKASEDMVIGISRWTDSVVAVELAKRLQEELNIKIEDQEIVSLSIHLASKRIIRNFDESIHRIIMNFDVNQILNNMLEAMNSKWHIDFHQDEELKSQLLLHLLPLEVRSRYNVVLQNPLIDKIKQQNILAYHLAVIACHQLHDYHGNYLSDEEIGYIALYINFALLRKQINEKKNVLVMCAVGRGTSRTLAYQVKELCGKYINEIKVIDYIGLKKYDFENIDLVVSSIPIKYELPVPKIEVNYFLSDLDKRRLETSLNEQEKFGMEHYISHVLMHMDGKTKEEVITHIIKQTFDDEEITTSIIENDQIGNYELENMTAILSCYTNQHSTQVIISVLPKPILWNMRKVQVIIIPIIGEPINSKIIDLYNELSYLVQNPLYLKRIIKKHTQEEIFKVFKEIEILREQ